MDVFEEVDFVDNCLKHGKNCEYFAVSNVHVTLCYVVSVKDEIMCWGDFIVSSLMFS